MNPNSVYKNISMFLTSMVLIVSCDGINQEEVERIALETHTVANSESGTSASTEIAYEFIGEEELQNLPMLQLEFVRDLVKASRSSDQELRSKRLHSNVLAHSRCSELADETIFTPPIRGQFSVKVKPGENPKSLHFSIKHQDRDQSNRPDFILMKNVVMENGRLVVNMNCEAVLNMLDQMQNYKEWENDHECGYKIKYDNNSAIKSSSGVSSEIPVEGAELYEYCLSVCETNVELNSKGMKSYQCYINHIEIEKSLEKLKWDKLNQEQEAS